jgi:hypothetical protein
VGTALGLTRADVWDASHEIRAAGTKTHARDRIASVRREPFSKVLPDDIRCHRANLIFRQQLASNRAAQCL